MALNTQELDIPTKTFSPEQIIAKLRQTNVAIDLRSSMPVRT